MLAACAIAPIPPVEISGTVRDADGTPLANATVALRMGLWVPPFGGDRNLLLQLTRSARDGTYRFPADADRDFRFPLETREYAVFALRSGYRGGWSGWVAPDAERFDLVLEAYPPTWRESVAGQCSDLCAGLDRADTRRVAEFHFGDKTRCDAWYEHQF